MPQITVKGIKREEMPALAAKARPELAAMIGCPEDWLTFEWRNSSLFDSKGRPADFPVITVWWFERPLDIQDKVAGFLDMTVREMGYETSQISFHLFEERRYYEDGEHY